MMTYDTATAADLGLMQGFPPPPDKQVTLENGFWIPPYNRWAYQNMRRLMPSAPLRPADTPIPLDRAPDNRIAALTIKRPDGSAADFDSFLRETFTDSLVVMAGDRIVHESLLNGMTARTPHLMMSCTKSFAGLFALMLVDEGRADEGDRIADLLPDVALGSGFAEATLGQVLDMTNSLHFNEDYADTRSHIHDYARITGLGDRTGHDGLPRTIQDYLCQMEQEGGIAHGAAFHYQSPKTDMLNWVNSRLAGKPFTRQAEDRLWSPLGTDGEAYVLLDPAGTEIAAGGLNATPHDLARFAAMIAARGAWKGRQLVPARVIDTIARGGSTDLFMASREGAGLMADGHWSYRAQWWVRRTPGREAITAQGIYGQWLYCDIERGIAIVKQSSQPVAVEEAFDDYTITAFDRIVETLTP
ncbi:serine hydrolase domain-containing protein [Chachezhania sediminis]|uniref:serine hydrolase domain-containing protein n=1 Tax=Chachezhania sediminis TaxID=2599291 RepID=UPI00131BC414|nr:serine hydrolase [Chachezhania sediminis]